MVSPVGLEPPVWGGPGTGVGAPVHPVSRQLLGPSPSAPPNVIRLSRVNWVALTRPIPAVPPAGPAVVKTGPVLTGVVNTVVAPQLTLAAEPAAVVARLMVIDEAVPLTAGTVAACGIPAVPEAMPSSGLIPVKSPAVPVRVVEPLSQCTSLLTVVPP